jgi:hypothetical protein
VTPDDTPWVKPLGALVLLLFVDLDPELAALRPLGGFFVLRTGGAPPGPLPTLARTYENPASEVYGNSLTFRVHVVAERLQAPELRIAASIAQQALAARLWSVALGCAALYGRIPDLDPRLLHWDADRSAPDDLWLAEVRPLPADALAETVLHGHLEPLNAALVARHRIATGLLWGNAASALAGAARELDRWARTRGRRTWPRARVRSPRNSSPTRSSPEPERSPAAPSGAAAAASTIGSPVAGCAGTAASHSRLALPRNAASG